MKKIVFGVLSIIIVSSLLSATPNIQSVKALTASNIVVTTYTDNRVLKLDSDGNIIWNKDTGSPTYDAAVNPNDGTIYVISHDYLTKLDKNGNWLVKTDISFMSVYGVGGPVRVAINPNDGSVCVAALGGPYSPFGVYKFSSDLSYLWYRQVDFQSVAMNPTDGTVYINGYTQGVYKYDLNGNLIWNTYLGGYENSYGAQTIAVDALDGSAVATTRFGGPATKLDTNGNIVWQAFGFTDIGSVDVDPGRNAAYIIDTAKLQRLDLSNGKVIWEQNISDSLTTGLAVDHADGSIYVTDWHGNLYKVHPATGDIIWSKNVGYMLDRVSIESKTVSPPVGGYSTSIKAQTKIESVLPYIASIAALTAIILTILRPKKPRIQTARARYVVGRFRPS
jgi:hypothetical protein